MDISVYTIPGVFNHFPKLEKNEDEVVYSQEPFYGDRKWWYCIVINSKNRTIEINKNERNWLEEKYIVDAAEETINNLIQNKEILSNIGFTLLKFPGSYLQKIIIDKYMMSRTTDTCDLIVQ